MAERKALGKGLSALLGVTEGSAPLEKIYRVGIGEIRPDPDQPRREMDGEGLESLAACSSRRARPPGRPRRP